MKFKTYIWDFDGMLFNTYPRMCDAFLKALSENGIGESRSHAMTAIKKSVRSAVKEYAATFGRDPQKLSADYHRIEDGMGPETIIPYPDTFGFLSAVKAQGGKHFLYTHRNRVAIEALKRYDMYSMFDGFITADDPFPVKPAPDALLYLVRRYEIDPKTALMLGDRDIDILAAKNAGLAGCLVDPEHFYDDFDTPLKCGGIRELYALLDVKLPQ